MTRYNALYYGSTDGWQIYDTQEYHWLPLRSRGQSRADATEEARARNDGRWIGDERHDHDEEEARREMMVEAGQRRPDSIDWMRDGDARHFYDDTLPMGGDNEPY